MGEASWPTPNGLTGVLVGGMTKPSSNLVIKARAAVPRKPSKQKPTKT